MGSIFLHPHIIRKLFAGLDAQDVEQCRFVCKAWHQEAIRWLRKYPHLGCSQNGVDFRDTQDLDRDRLLHGLVIHDRFITEELKNFAGNKTLVPSLAFFRVDQEILGGFWGVVPFDYPTVIVECGSISASPAVTGHPNCNGEISYFEAFKLNRYISDHKIIITEWSDPINMKPELGNEEYPIKTLIYLIKPWCNFFKMMSFIRSSNLECSGATLDSLDEIYFKNSSMEPLETTKNLTIAFAGKNVKSAILSICITSIESPVLDQLTLFKKNLDFPIADGRVFGFFYSKSENFDQPLIEEAWNSILTSFPQVQFIRIKTWDSEDSPTEMSTLHLIRI